MESIERENASLKGILPKVFAKPNLDKAALGGLIDLIGDTAIGSEAAKSKDSINNAVLMDRKNIRYGGGASAIEFCDVYDSDNKAFIHVKNYYGSSALSHLFAQGRVSGQLFKSDKKFREKVLEKEPIIPIDPNISPNPSDYKIIFGVISKSDANLDLPFFSKVNFKNEKKLLNTFGFNDVKLVKIKRS